MMEKWRCLDCPATVETDGGKPSWNHTFEHEHVWVLAEAPAEVRDGAPLDLQAIKDRLDVPRFTSRSKRSDIKKLIAEVERLRIALQHAQEAK